MKYLLLAVFQLWLWPVYAQTDLVLGTLTKKQKPREAKLLFDESGRAISIVTLKDGRQLHVTDEGHTSSQTYWYEQPVNGEVSKGALPMPPGSDEMLGGSQLVLQRVAGGYLLEYYVEQATGTLSLLRTHLASGAIQVEEVLAINKEDYPIMLQQAAEGLHYLVMVPKANLFKLHRIGFDGTKTATELKVDLQPLYADGRLDAKKDGSLNKVFAGLGMMNLLEVKGVGVADSLKPGNYHEFARSAGMQKNYLSGDTIMLFTNASSGLSMVQVNIVPASNHLSVKTWQSTATASSWLQQWGLSANYPTAADFDKQTTPVSIALSKQYLAVVRTDKPHLYIQYFDRASGELRHMEHWSADDASVLSSSQIKQAPWFVDATETKAMDSTKFLRVAVAQLGIVAFELVESSPDSLTAVLMVKDERVKLSDVAGALVESAAFFIPVGSVVGAFAAGAASAAAGMAVEAALSMVNEKEVYCLSRQLNARSLAASTSTQPAPLTAIQQAYQSAQALQQSLPPGVTIVALASFKGQQYLSHFDAAASQYKLRKL